MTAAPTVPVRVVECVACARTGVVAAIDRYALPVGWGYRWADGVAVPVCTRCYYAVRHG